MNFNKFKIKYVGKLVIIILFISFTLTAFAGWQIPNTNPGVSSNRFLPVFNTSLSSQQKMGALVIDEGFRSLGPVIFDTTLLLPISGYGAGKVLTSDAQGFATWQTASGGGGSTNGWTFTAGTPNTVSMTNAGDNLVLGSTAVIYKGDTTVTNRFLHNTGTENIFVGVGSGKLSVFGPGNTSFGFNTISNISSTLGAEYNTILGSQSTPDMNAGSYNTNIGYRSSFSFTNTGKLGKNTVIGAENSYSNQQSQENTSAGYRALYNHTSGNTNTALGSNALINNTTGSNNTAIGYNAGPSTGALTNTLAIGNGASVTTSNTMVLGNSAIVGTGIGTQPGSTAFKVGTGTTNGNGANLTLTGTWTSTSDRTKKHDILDLSLGLKEILKLRPVSFKWNDTNKEDIGLIAQEVKEVIPEVVYGEEGNLSIGYSQIAPVLINAVREQQDEIETYKKTIEEYEKRVEYLESLKNKN